MNNLDLNEKLDSNSDSNLSSGAEASPLLIHFRCPDCSKLYSSDPTKIFVEQPEYVCKSCETEFTVSLIRALEQPEVIGVKKQKTPVLKAETVELPNLESLKPSVGTTSGDIVKELVEKRKETPKEVVSFADLNLQNKQNKFDLLWQDVLSNYEDRTVHHAFLKVCQDENELDLAVQRYANVLRANPNDKIAKSFITRMQIEVETKAFASAEQSHKFFNQSFYITLAVVCVGASLICAGLVLGDNKNIAGLGIALIFFTFAVKAFFQPRRPSVG